MPLGNRGLLAGTKAIRTLDNHNRPGHEPHSCKNLAGLASQKVTPSLGNVKPTPYRGSFPCGPAVLKLQLVPILTVFCVQMQHPHANGNRVPSTQDGCRVQGIPARVCEESRQDLVGEFSLPGGGCVSAPTEKATSQSFDIYSRSVSSRQPASGSARRHPRTPLRKGSKSLLICPLHAPGLRPRAASGGISPSAKGPLQTSRVPCLKAANEPRGNSGNVTHLQTRLLLLPLAMEALEAPELRQEATHLGVGVYFRILTAAVASLIVLGPLWRVL